MHMYESHNIKIPSPYGNDCEFHFLLSPYFLLAVHKLTEVEKYFGFSVRTLNKSIAILQVGYYSL